MNRKSEIPVVLFGIITTGYMLATISGCSILGGNEEDKLITDLEAMTYLTEHYPPLNYEYEGKLYGLSLDIFDELMHKMNSNISRKDVILKNWSDAYHQTQNEEHTVLFSIAKLPGRESKFKWAGPMVPVKYIVITKASGNIVINAISDLNSYTTGVIKDDAGELILKEKGLPAGKMVLFDDVHLLFSALDNGSVDCAVYSETGSDLIIKSLGLNAAEYKSVFMVSIIETFFSFHLKTSDVVIEFFQQNLDQLKMDKTQDGSSVYEKILNKYQVIQHIDDKITPEMVISLVNQTVSDISKDVSGTFSKINQQLAPYRDALNPALYAFVYDTAVNIKAHADNLLMVGKNFKGKTDAAGKKFRDDIVSGALKNQTGWVDYIYTKTDQSGLYYKTAYYKLVRGSDGVLYVACAGRFK